MLKTYFPIDQMKSYEFKINWAYLLTVAIFWLFAICGYPSGSKINETSLNVVIVLAYAYLVSNYNSSHFHSFFRVKLSTLPYVVAFTILAFTFSFDRLSQSLWGDQIYHANFASRHAQLFIYYAEADLPGIWSHIKNLQASHIVSAINLFLIFLLSIVFYILPKTIKWGKYYPLFIMVFVMFAVRHLVEHNHAFDGIDFPPGLNAFGIVDPHPLFRAFPLVFSTSFFGSADFGFRVISFIAYLLFLYFFFNKLKPVAGSGLAFCGMFAIATVPIFWSISYLVEQSIWSTIASSIIFTVLATSEKLEKEPVVPLVAIVILATLLRSPAFVGFIPVAFILIFKIYKKTLSNKNENLSLLVLLFLLIIVVAVSAARGSPATETLGVFEKWFFSLNNNIPAIADTSVLGLIPIFFIGKLLSFKSDKRVLVSLAAAVFLFVGTFLYYGPLIRELWGVSRYQAEIFIPLIVCGVTIYCLDANATKLRFTSLKFLPLLVFIAINLISLKNIDVRTFKPFVGAPPPTEGIKAEIEYPLKQVYKFAELNGLKNNLYYVGIYYGGFVSVLGGYSAKDYLSFSRLNLLYRNGWEVDSEKLNADSEIKAVVIEPEASFGVTDKLLALGWVKTCSFIHARSKHELILLRRKPN